eukprot:7635589-Alexandrium_andersonii.AAC.1
MSASLVGSEMCIRDRFCGVLVLLRVLVACWALVSRRMLAFCGVLMPLRICLLYTSDAADDM